MQCKIDDKTIRAIAKSVFGINNLNRMMIMVIRGMNKNELRKQYHKLPSKKRDKIKKEYPQVLLVIS